MNERADRKLMSTVLGIVFATLIFGSAHAQSDFPSRDITIVVPYSKGGPTDRIARPVAAGLANELGVPVILEYITGQGGTKAPRTMTANPDRSGYRLLLHHMSMATAPSLYRNLGYEPLRDFAPIGQVVDVPMLLLGRQGLLPNGQDLGQFLVTRQDDLVVAYSGAGSSSQMCTLLLERATGAKFFWVAYKGSAGALKDMAKQRVDFYCDQTPSALPLVDAGTASAYAVTAPKRLGLRPDIPTTSQAGLNNLQISVFVGLYAMAGTPTNNVYKISDALQRVVASPRYIATMSQQGAVAAKAAAATPEHLTKLLRAETKRWRPIIRKAGQFAD